MDVRQHPTPLLKARGETLLGSDSHLAIPARSGTAPARRRSGFGKSRELCIGEQRNERLMITKFARGVRLVLTGVVSCRLIRCFAFRRVV